MTRLLLSALLLLLCVTDARLFAQESLPSRHVLMVTQSAGYQHSAVTRSAKDLSHAERVMQQIGIESGTFRVDFTQDVEQEFTPARVSQYDAVCFYTTGDLPIPTETLDWFLRVYLAEEGHGFLGVHSATDTYKEHEPFWDMIGGTFQSHPWTSSTPVTIKVNDSSHPASRAWGATGTRIAMTEEIYLHKNWQPEKVRVLMSLDMEQTALKRPQHIPVMWVKEYGEGRVMNCSLGHREAIWDMPPYQASLAAGLAWLFGDVQADATPNPELSAAEQRLAEEACKQ